MPDFSIRDELLSVKPSSSLYSPAARRNSLLAKRLVELDLDNEPSKKRAYIIPNLSGINRL